MRIWDVTKGIPLAIKIAAGLYSEWVSIDQITEEVEGRKEIIDKMVYRYLQHTRIDGEERNKLSPFYAERISQRPCLLPSA
ncbi:hypothetical protein [Ktedonospora formicarum]|uniref:Uncharacterized protein n=1 Tax=Ktedonospora formicarum TaxID=2778364 RepID=A0A8J3IBJ4_9CHLR|nr:hypothetical protein [Ktedonospora formicarum]GHO49039.1 hypothetical protein KSX_72020 [Ktedonospora formicarum]